MSHLFAQADATALPLPDQSVDLVFTSPPYLSARTYGIGAQRTCMEWIEWMLDVVAEATRVSRGLVLVNCAGVTRDRVYQPGPEGLCYEWWKRGGNLWRPAYWHRVGIPGSGGKQWLRADIEHVLCFKRDREWLPWADSCANGHPPKYGPGGQMSHRVSNGARVNQRGHSFATGEQLPNRVTSPPSIANPGCLVQGIPVGGGKLGHPMAHLNEAPFPVKFAMWFIRSWCPPGGIVLDPFSGSGTTVDAARRLGRHGIGFDLRASQCELGTRRMNEPVKAAKPKKLLSVGEPTLFHLTA